MWSRHSRRSVPINRSAIGFCQGERGAVGVSSNPNFLICILKSSLKILSLLRMTYFVVSSKAKVSLNCWMAHSACGFEVMPKCNILRLSCEIATNTCIDLKKIVRITIKSMPTMCFAWFRRKVSHRCRLPSSDIGFRIYFSTVLSQTLNPSFASSPWILYGAQVWFSLCIFRISFISSQSIVGLPTLRDFHFQ